MLAALAPAATAYGDPGAANPHESQVDEACATCYERLGTATGDSWTRCVIDDLLARQERAKAAGSDAYFPIAPHDLQPLGPVAGASRAGADSLNHLLRNYTCDVADGGSQPLRSLTWEWQPPDPCEGVDGNDGGYGYTAGYLPAGNDLPGLGAGGTFTEEEAQTLCRNSPKCRGFTYSAPTRDQTAKHTVLFKSSGDGASEGAGWHAFRKKYTVCDPQMPMPPPPALRVRVDVLREEPPVYVVHDFLSEWECAFMMNTTIPHMSRSVVFSGSKGATSSYRQSYTVNMLPDYSDEDFVVTRISRRKFAFAREVAGYDELVEGPGQEPINAVYYKDYGDQYRAHCDGECHGGPYSKGRRIATSLSYCEVADTGGYTIFTRSGLKVVPKARQMLFFGYKLKNSRRMDNGLTEHTGCPIREGRKWIATQWYREGMTAERGWEKMQH